MITGLLGTLVIAHLLARTGRGRGWAAARMSAATLGGLAGGVTLLSGAAGRWSADLSPAAPVGESVLNMALTCAGATLLIVTLGLAARHRDGGGDLGVAAGLAACLGGLALVDAVVASWTGQPAGGLSTAAFGAALRGGVLAGAGLVLVAAGLRGLSAEHSLRRAAVAADLCPLEPPLAGRDRVVAEPVCELAA